MLLLTEPWALLLCNVWSLFRDFFLGQPTVDLGCCPLSSLAQVRATELNGNANSLPKQNHHIYRCNRHHFVRWPGRGLVNPPCLAHFTLFVACCFLVEFGALNLIGWSKSRQSLRSSHAYDLAFSPSLYVGWPLIASEMKNFKSVLPQVAAHSRARSCYI